MFWQKILNVVLFFGYILFDDYLPLIIEILKFRSENSGPKALELTKFAVILYFSGW